MSLPESEPRPSESGKGSDHTPGRSLTVAVPNSTASGPLADGRGSEPLAHGRGSERAGLILLFVLAAGLGLNSALIHPIRNYLLDFRGYYAAGVALRLGINPYDTAAVREHVTLPGKQWITVYVYPPPTLPLIYVLGLVPYPAVQVPWCLFQYTLLVGALWLVLRALDCPLGSPTSVLIGFVFLSSASVGELFRWGQFDGVVLALLAAAFLALQRRRLPAAGAWLGLAVVAKVTPLLYLGVLVLRKDVKALVAAVLTIALLTGGSYAVFGSEVFRQWVLGLSAFGSFPATLSTPNNMSLLAFVYRALVNQPNAPGPSVPWVDLGADAARACTVGLLLVIMGITGWWMLRNRGVLNTAECVAAALPVALLTSSVTWVHHGVQLLIPLALITVTMMRQPRLRTLDVTWLVLILLLYMNWPIQRFNLELPSWLAHLAGPTLTYATSLTWLFMIVRFVSVKQAAAAPPAPAATRAAASESAEVPPSGRALTAATGTPGEDAGRHPSRAEQVPGARDRVRTHSVLETTREQAQ